MDEIQRTVGEFDVVVVGHGIGGLCAGITAAEAGASTVVLEKSPEDERGGQTQFTKGLRTAISKLDPASYPEYRLDSAMEYTENDFFDDLMRLSEGRADETLCRTLVDDIVETTDFLNDRGVEWRDDVYPELFAGIPDAKSPGVLWFDGGGMRAIESLETAAEDAGVEFRYRHRAADLRRDEDGVLAGVDVETPEGMMRFDAGAALVCAGGFESNREMVARYVDEGDLYTLRGSPYNTGDVLEAAMESGAAPTGNWSDVHATLIDDETPFDGGAGATNVVGFQFGILVNRHGERFIDEGEGRYSLSYVLTKEVHKQPGREAFLVADDLVSDYVYSLGETEPEQFDSVDAIADAYDVDSDRLAETMASFTDAVEPGSFNPRHPDGKAASGIDPPKSNWAIPFGDGPYHVIPAKAGITFTLGGLKIDSDARVLDSWDDPIPGLYAAGNSTGGFFYGNYPGGAGLARASVFGRRAAAHAVDYVS